MKKNILIILAFIINIFIINIAQASNINVALTVLDSKTEKPLQNLVVNKSEGLDNIYKLVTNEKGKIKFNFTYIEGWQNLVLRINWNSVNIQSLDNSNNTIIILYDLEQQKIIEVKFAGKKIIDNQDVVRNTNYTLLALFFFITITFWTIIVLGKFSYDRMGLDIIKHK